MLAKTIKPAAVDSFRCHKSAHLAVYPCVVSHAVAATPRLGNGQARSCNELKPQQRSAFWMARMWSPSFRWNMWLHRDSMPQRDVVEGEPYAAARVNKMNGIMVVKYQA
jgi:hypothetical protein